MIVDSSAVLAILLQEPEAGRIALAIERAARVYLPASCLLECSITLLARHRSEGLRDLDLLVARGRMEVVSFTESQARTAREAFCRYGKGIHPAALNFGDCMAYAAAVESGEELLFKGNDFSRTDVLPANY
jgi:ribonuclease VapC